MSQLSFDMNIPIRPYSYAIIGRLAGLSDIVCWRELYLHLSNQLLQSRVKKVQRQHVLSSLQSSRIYAFPPLSRGSLTEEWFTEMCQYISHHPHADCRYFFWDDPLRTNTISRFQLLIRNTESGFYQIMDIGNKRIVYLNEDPMEPRKWYTYLSQMKVFFGKKKSKSLRIHLFQELSFNHLPSEVFSLYSVDFPSESKSACPICSSFIRSNEIRLKLRHVYTNKQDPPPIFYHLQCYQQHPPEPYTSVTLTQINDSFSNLTENQKREVLCYIHS